MNPPTIGEMNPEIAKKFGLDPDQVEMLSKEVRRWEGKIHLVTFTSPPARPDGKKDPIAYLPPGFSQYGIVDRDHRTRVSVGETWLVEGVEKIPGTPFLIPLLRLDLKTFLDLQPERIQSLATYLATKNPGLAKEFAGKLPVLPGPGSESEVESLKKQVQRLESGFDQLTKEKASLETELGQLKAQKQTAAPPAPASGTIRPRIALGPVLGRPVQPPTGVPRDSLLGHLEGVLHRIDGDTVQSDLLVHPCYEIHLTGDLYRVLFRPSIIGVPCSGGRIVVRGLSRVDTKPPPADYPTVWDGRAGGFLAYIGHG